MFWHELTSAALDQADRDLPIVLPIAATEQHGPHLPLATDRLIADHFCGELNKARSNDLLILPTMAVGCSRHHMDFPGSLTLTHETFAAHALELLESALHHRFRNFLILNSHGGNQGVGQVILETFGARHPQSRIVLATWWRAAAEPLAKITETGPGGVGHACEFETSLIELIAPELIDRQAIRPGANIPTFDWAEGDMLRSPSASLYRTMKQMTSNGAYGRPDKASAEKGTAITRVVIAALLGILTDLRQPA